MPARTSPHRCPAGGTRRRRSVRWPAERRGPFRPARLRHPPRPPERPPRRPRLPAGRPSCWSLVAVVALDVAAPGSLLDRVGGAAALPCRPRRAVVTGRLLRSFGMYRFGRRERAVVHAVGVVGAVAAGAVVGVVTPWAGPRTSRCATCSWRGRCRRWPCSLVLHAVWWTIVRRWRSQGRLTPNIVIVGATSHAEQIVADALAERDVNVLGIFDDRLARSPRDVPGVPVLGDVAALVSHRITPYVDLIVIAVDPTAQRRVQEVMRASPCCPNDVALVVDDDGAEPARRVRRLADSRRWRRSTWWPTPAGGRSPSGCRTSPCPASRSCCSRRCSPLIALAVRLDSPGPGVLPPAPARLQQRGDRGVEVPHDAPRDRRPHGRAAGHRRRRPGHPGRADPAQDEPRRAAAAAQRVAAARCRWSARAARHRHEDGRGGVGRRSSPSTPSATGSSPA